MITSIIIIFFLFAIMNNDNDKNKTDSRKTVLINYWSLSRQQITKTEYEPRLSRLRLGVRLYDISYAKLLVHRRNTVAMCMCVCEQVFYRMRDHFVHNFRPYRSLLCCPSKVLAAKDVHSPAVTFKRAYGVFGQHTSVNAKR